MTTDEEILKKWTGTGNLQAAIRLYREAENSKPARSEEFLELMALGREIEFDNGGVSHENVKRLERMKRILKEMGWAPRKENDESPSWVMSHVVKAIATHTAKDAKHSAALVALRTTRPQLLRKLAMQETKRGETG